MAKLISLGAAVAKHRFVHFNRTELTLLLNLYSRRVAEGEWRDYAIDQGADRAVFSIYRHTLERPVLTITKQADDNRSLYVVANPERELARCGALTDALATLDRVPRLVP